MYEEHPTFIQPDDESTKVWRYMDFTKLVSLIDSRRLYFTRADKFNDPFEGSYPKLNVAARTILPPDIEKDLDVEQRERIIEALRQSGETNRHWPRYTAINCWHLNAHESAAMWSLYLKSDEGVAIQWTYAKLKSSFVDDEKVFLGMVRYLDYETEFMQSGNILEPFVHKRKSFEHEREVRAVAMKWPVSDDGINFETETIDHGMQLRVDLEQLVESVYVAPSAPTWFGELVSSVISRYGYNFDVVHSSLNDEPVY